jgi:hypothetical protein
MTDTIKLNNTGIRIRPSAIENFYTCPYQWGKVFLEGVTTIPNARAAIGTGIHKAVEELWTDAKRTGKKDANIGKLADVATESFKEESQKGMRFDEGENVNTAIVEMIKGTEAFIEDIVPFTQIPDAVESFVSVAIEHPIVSEIGGTIDYLHGNTIADVKTSKRKISASKYTTQQSTYKYLAEANGHKIEHNLIQGVVLKAKSEGTILTLEPRVDEAKARINMILDTLDLIAEDVAPIDLILRPNPGHFLCDPKYCSLYPCKVIKDS